MVHLAGCLFKIGVIEDVVPRFHAAGLVPGYFHANTLVNPGETHIADGRSAEVVKEQCRDASRLARFTPTVELRTHWTRVMEEDPGATVRTSVPWSGSQCSIPP
jgi:hypothetical protein